MRSPTLLALIVLALTASACATAGPEASPPASAASTGSPAPVEGYDWFFHADEGAARLAYGLAESDDLLSLIHI